MTPDEVLVAMRELRQRTDAEALEVLDDEAADAWVARRQPRRRG